MVKCPLCGKEVSNYHYLGQHIDKKDDSLHSGVDTDELKSGDNPGNLLDEYEETAEEELDKLNEIETPDTPADQSQSTDQGTDNWTEISELPAEDFTTEEIRKLKAAEQKGFSEYNTETGELR